jgi:hypothetical protein
MKISSFALLSIVLLSNFSIKGTLSLTNENGLISKDIINSTLILIDYGNSTINSTNPIKFKCPQKGAGSEYWQRINRIKDTFWTFIFPIISVFGIITNLINILVFSHKELRSNNLFVYMLFYSIADFFYLLQVFFIWIARCASYCPGGLNITFIGTFYNLYSWNYLTSVLAIFAIFMEISISFTRFTIVANYKWCSELSAYIVCACLFPIALIYYLPSVLAKKIVKDDLVVKDKSNFIYFRFIF